MEKWDVRVIGVLRDDAVRKRGTLQGENIHTPENKVRISE